MSPRFRSVKAFLIVSSILILATALPAQKLQKAKRLWSKGPLTKPQVVGGFYFDSSGMHMTGQHVDSQTQSLFSATRSIAFVRDRVILASRTGSRTVPGSSVPKNVYQLLSLDSANGAVKDSREFLAGASIQVFATNDDHVIVIGSETIRLTPDLKNDGIFEDQDAGHKSGRVENMSPDGSNLGYETMPGFDLLDARNFRVTRITSTPSVSSSVSSKGFLTDNIKWVGKYPNEPGFVTYTDVAGQHLLYHGSCTGRPEFLSDNLILVPCKGGSVFVDADGKTVKSLEFKGNSSYAGVSQNGKRFALQIGEFSSDGTLKKEKFLIYSTDTWELVTEVAPDQVSEGQSWTAFSPDGYEFAVGSPLKLALYRLP